VSAAEALVGPLQRALDALIAARARTRAQAATLDGRTVAVELRGFGIALAFSGEDERLIVRAGDDAPAPDATLAGPLPAFLRALASDPTVLPPGLTVSGDALLVRDLRTLLAGLEFDWEERASRVVGDAAAHQLGRMARAFGGWSRHAGDRLSRDLAEYLREETRDLVAKDEVAAFNDGVDAVRSDVERTAARLALLERALQARGGPGDAGAADATARDGAARDRARRTP